MKKDIYSLDPPKLRPSINNPDYWYVDHNKKKGWKSLRKLILLRDDYTCVYCGHRALKNMNIHHIRSSRSYAKKNLVTVCSACHRILHLGHSMMHGWLGVYKTNMSQVEIVRFTRMGISKGLSLSKINMKIPKTRGKYRPDSPSWTENLLNKIESSEYRISLNEPYSAIFTNYSLWQIENTVQDSLHSY